MPVWKPVWKPAVVTPTAAAASAKAGVAASAAASATTQGITQTQSVGAVTGNNNTVNFGRVLVPDEADGFVTGQTASNTATTTTINTAIAWGTNRYSHKWSSLRLAKTPRRDTVQL